MGGEKKGGRWVGKGGGEEIEVWRIEDSRGGGGGVLGKGVWDQESGREG